MPSYPIPDGPHNDPWKSLLPYACAVVDEVVETHNVPFPIQIGGGSMLLRRYKHRKSKDLDLFVTDTRLVRWSSPRHNESAADLFADYGEEATAVKLIMGVQEVDIVAAAPIIDDAVEHAVLNNREMLIERPREILAKKLIYRGLNFQPRDVFDLACVAEAEPEEVALIQPYLSLTHLDDLQARLDEIEPILGKELADKVESYPEFEHIIGQCLDITRGIVRDLRENLTPKVTVPPYPQGTHKPVFSRDGNTVVIKEFNQENGRFDKIGNTLGPAIIGPEGKTYFIGGVQLSEDDWKHHPEVGRHD